MGGTVPEAGHGDSAKLLSVASNPALSEDLALALLKRRDLSSGEIEKLSKNAAVMKSRKVKLALVQHRKTPRRVAMALLRHLFTFELMRVTLDAGTLADVRKVAEHQLIGRLEGISLGEKLTLARRASGPVAGELLLDAEPRVVQTALDNSRLTESMVIRVILHRNASSGRVLAVCQHPKWALRREVRIALLRNKNTPLVKALEFARGLPPTLVDEILRSSSLPVDIKSALLEGVHPNT